MADVTKISKLPWIFFGITLAGLIVVVAIFLSKQGEMTKQLKALEAKNIEKIAQSQQPTPPTETEIASLVKEVGGFVQLPEGDEIPTVATVSDLTVLKGQEFFARAAVGDKVLVYKNAKFAVLYRPNTKKVLTASAVAIGAVPTAGMIKETPTPTQATKEARSSFLLLNGTTIVGLTKKIEEEILKTYPNAIIVDKDNAKKKTYENSLLIDMTEKRDVDAKNIANKLSLELSDLPIAEATSGGSYDFLIIVGADKK